jgi:hypothetical protein
MAGSIGKQFTKVQKFLTKIDVELILFIHTVFYPVGWTGGDLEEGEMRDGTLPGMTLATSNDNDSANTGVRQMANVSTVLDALGTLSTTGAGGYVAALVGFAASLSLAQWSIVVGIVTALVSCIVNVVYTARKDRREERALNAQLEAKTAMATKKSRLKSGIS